jgi:membrane protease YdiL (CAAX protease family)
MTVNGEGATLKRWILAGLTLLAIGFTALQLLSSWNQPQFQSRLELYQTNLLLRASEWQGSPGSEASLSTTRRAIVGADPIQAAAKQYQEARRSNQDDLDKIRTRLESSNQTDDSSQLRSSAEKLARLTAELDLNLGVLQAHQAQTQAALATWQQLIPVNPGQPTSLAETAQVLIGLWSTPPKLLPDAETHLQTDLSGWFRDQSLKRLFQLQQRQDALAALSVAEQQAAEQAFMKLGLVSLLPGLGLLLGGGLLLFGLGKWLLWVIRGSPTLADKQLLDWQVPWDWEVVVQGLVIGFFFVGQFLIGQFLLPLGLGLLKINPANLDNRGQAGLILLSYLMLAVGGGLVIYLSLKPFFPLPEGWFRFQFNRAGLGWGLAGYCIAWPVVLAVSQLNQLIWQGQGGSNPILPIALEGKDPTAIAIFFITASLAAPIFEEILFRGFLLPSLTRYLPIWGAIAASGLLFAIAHLSLSEILPLAALGMVLGYVYVRSRNLLACMLLHSLWNGGTLLSLFILGGSGGM